MFKNKELEARVLKLEKEVSRLTTTPDVRLWNVIMELGEVLGYKLKTIPQLSEEWENTWIKDKKIKAREAN